MYSAHVLYRWTLNKPARCDCWLFPCRWRRRYRSYSSKLRQTTDQSLSTDRIRRSGAAWLTSFIINMITCIFNNSWVIQTKQTVRQAATILPRPYKFTFDLLTLNVVSELRTPILVFLDLSVLDLGPVYATDRQTSDRRQTRIIA